MRNVKLIAIMAAATIAGCQSGNYGGGQAPTITAPAKPAVEGQWIGTDGVAISTFQAGKFTSALAQSGEPLTEGSYTVEPNGLIKIQFYSVKAQKDVAANCLIAEGTRLNCTLDNGTQFSLVRKSIG